MKPTSMLVATLFVVAFAAIGLLGFKVFAEGDAASPAADVPIGSAFTYQGRVTTGDAAVTGSCDMKLGLFDAATGGGQVGSTLEQSAVAVQGGVCPTRLDFGDAAFAAGQARFLEIALRCPAGGGAYETLAPRQDLAAAPFAQYASHAPWSGLTGIPDGIGSPSQYDHVVVVAKSGGDFTSIQAAIDSVQSNAAERHLVWVAPGTYEERVTVTSYVDLVGAGRNLTTIISAGGATTEDAATVTLNTRSSMRNLTVTNFGGGTAFATAMLTKQGGTVRLADVELSASGAANNTGILDSYTWIEAQTVVAKVVDANAPSSIGAVLQQGGISTFRDVELQTSAQSATGIQIGGSETYLNMEHGGISSNGPTAYGVFASQAGYLSLTDVNVGAYSSGEGRAEGLSLVGGLTLLDGGTISATGGNTAIGIEAYNAGPQIDRTRMMVQSAQVENIGIRHTNGGSPALTDVIINANGAGGRALTNTPGDGAAPASTIRIMRSTLQGSANSIGAFTPNVTYKVSGSHLDGPIGAIGAYACANSDGSNFKPLTAACQATP